MTEWETYGSGSWEAKRRCAEQNHAYKDEKGAWKIPDANISSLGIIKKRNGTDKYILLCRKCGKASSSDLPKHVVQKLIQDGRPIEWHRDNSANDSYGEIIFDGSNCCVRYCQNAGFEMHHFAPRNIFPDAEQWPYLPVCLKHHRYWHEMMDNYTKNSKTPDDDQFRADREWYDF